MRRRHTAKHGMPLNGPPTQTLPCVGGHLSSNKLVKITGGLASHLANTVAPQHTTYSTGTLVDHLGVWPCLCLLFALLFVLHGAVTVGLGCLPPGGKGRAGQRSVRACAVTTCMGRLDNEDR